MKKIMVLAAMAWSTFLFGAVDKSAGEAIFNDRGCVMCHQRDVETIGPSVRTIGIRYNANENGLVDYLKGHGQPIVYPERAGVMQPQLMKIGNLYEDEYRSLARFIIQSYMRVDF